MKKYIYLSILVLAGQLTASTAWAQLPFSFTQYMNNVTAFNPAYSTMDNATNLNVVGRKQWIGINGAPNTFLFNGSTPLTSINGSAGLSVLSDKVGPENLTEINVFVAKKIQLTGDNYLSASINGGFRNDKITYSALDPTDPSFQNSDVNQTIPNIGFSAMAFGSNYYVGLSVPRISFSKPVSNTNLQNTYYLTGAYIAPLSTDFKLKPAALLAYGGSNLPLSYDVSTTLLVKDVVGVGVNYRNDSNVAGLLSINFDNAFQLGYSYQFSVSNHPIGGINNTTQEISLSFRFGKSLGVKSL